MTAHTPGPWHRNVQPGKKYPAIFAGRNLHVALAQSVGLSDEEVEANIDLIASAPDLLAALKVLLEREKENREAYLESAIVPVLISPGIFADPDPETLDEDGKEVLAEYDAVIAQAEAAIAKARAS